MDKLNLLDEIKNFCITNIRPQELGKMLTFIKTKREQILKELDDQAKYMLAQEGK